ncbi:MAG: hypothetical protein LW719_04390 [Comamonadaceae bacterium]|nr:hypothetical protein [Comamonadaceae bacterium]
MNGEPGTPCTMREGGAKPSTPCALSDPYKAWLPTARQAERAGSQEVQEPVANHARAHLEAASAAQGLGNRHSQRAYAQLQSGAVRDQAGHLSGNALMNFGRCLLALLGQGPVGLRGHHHLAAVYAGFAADGGNAVVDLHHHGARRFHSVPGIVDGAGRAVIALRIGRRNLQKDHIGRQFAGCQQGRQLRQGAGHDPGTASGHQRPQRAHTAIGGHAQCLGHVLRPRGIERESAKGLQSADARSQLEQCLHQSGGLACGLPDQHLVARAQQLGQHGSSHRESALRLTGLAL